jgi:hypothetical protein
MGDGSLLLNRRLGREEGKGIIKLEAVPIKNHPSFCLGNLQGEG